MLVSNELEKLNTFDSSYYRSKNHFENEGTQNYLVLQPMYRYFKKIGSTDHISKWRFKGLSDKVIKPPAILDNSFTPALNHVCNKKRVKFDGICLKQEKMAYTHGKIVNIYIVFELSSNLNHFAFVLENYLFVALISTNIPDIVLDLIHIEYFYFLVVYLVKIKFLVLIWVLLYMLKQEKRYLNFLVKVLHKD